MNIADHSPSHDINSPDGLIDQSMITIQSDTNEKDVIPTKEPSTENKEKLPRLQQKIQKKVRRQPPMLQLPQSLKIIQIMFKIRKTSRFPI